MERGGHETNKTLRLSTAEKDVIDAERGKKETLTPGTPGMGDLHRGYKSLYYLALKIREVQLKEFL